MTTVTISEKGQLTLPAEIRKKLGVAKGSRVRVEFTDDKVIMTRVKSIRELKGALRKYAIPGMTWEKERDAAEQSMAEEAVSD